MILVDTSIWIELLSARKPHLNDEDLLRFATCGPIVQEVLQGLRPSVASDAFRDAFLALPILANPLPLSLFVQAAAIYADGRRRGLTIRSSIDCLIAAIAIVHSVPLWHRDRDFDAIAQYTPLQVVSL